MYPRLENLTINPVRGGGRKFLIAFATSVFMVCSLPVVAQQQPNKIQRSVDALKEAYYCVDADYHTDGQRVVWVKSYTKWTPDDFETIKKEAPLC